MRSLIVEQSELSVRVVVVLRGNLKLEEEAYFVTAFGEN